MNRSTQKLYSSDLDNVRYAECKSNGADNCTSIYAKNLSLSYNGSPAFSNVTLEIPPCQITTLIGPSGCGKTSFLQCLNRLTDLIPEATVTGGIKIGKIDIFSKNCDLVALRKRVGMIFQKPSPFPLSIRKNFHLALKEHGITKRSERDFMMENALKEVGLWSEVSGRLDQSATTLSGGQKQRLCIARTLSLKPEVLLLDEPCSALDPISSGIVEELISSLRCRYTVVLVTHNLNQARRLADFAAFFWLNNGTGQLIENGEIEQIFHSPESELTKAYISGKAG